jgi:branched-chain amino acid aminotransferase
MYDIKLTRTPVPNRSRIPPSSVLESNFTDHMFIADYTHEKGWHDARIIPFGNLSCTLPPPYSTMAPRYSKA